tara:strand:- start:6244 stop:7149 length:906 start_codon:yes stop_codon:yes gene_type:complete
MIHFSNLLGKLNRARKNPSLYRIIILKKILKYIGIKLEKDRNSIEWAFLLSGLSNFNVSSGGYVLSKKNKPLKNNITFIDIGANDGTFGPKFLNNYSKKYNLNITLHAFEPIKESYILLKKNCSKLNNIKKNFYNLAASNVDKEITIYKSNESKWNSINNSLYYKGLGGKEVMISLVRLDKMMLEKININDGLIIKVDTEGHEKEVLEGLGGLLENKIVDAIIIESSMNIEDIQHSYLPEIHEIMTKYNYRCAKFLNINTGKYWVWGDSFAISEFDVIYVKGNKVNKYYPNFKKINKFIKS